MTISSKAIIFDDERKARLGEIELPEPAEGQVLVKTH